MEVSKKIIGHIVFPASYNIVLLLLALVSVGGIVVPCWGGAREKYNPAPDAHAAKLTRSDKSFLRTAAEENQAAIELGEVAEQKGFSAVARNFARRLVAERSHAQQELLRLARALDLALPHELSRHDRKAKQQLEKHSGKELDQMFLSRMAVDLDQQYGSYEDAAMSTRNPAVKRYIENLLPDVKHQDQTAKAITPGQGAGSSDQ